MDSLLYQFLEVVSLIILQVSLEDSLVSSNSCYQNHQHFVRNMQHILTKNIYQANFSMFMSKFSDCVKGYGIAIKMGDTLGYAYGPSVS